MSLVKKLNSMQINFIIIFNVMKHNKLSLSNKVEGLDTFNWDVGFS